MSRRSMLVAAWLCAGALLAGSLGLVACGETDHEGVPEAVPRRESNTCDCAVGAAVVDPALLAFLSKAKAAHHRADLAEDDAQPELAIAVLEQLVNGPQPALTPEVREVMADSLARIAELRSARGGIDDIEDAKKDVDRGLALAEEVSHFRGRLMEVRGVVEQRLHDKLAEDGDEKGAAAAKQRAIAAFEQAVEIQDEVIKQALSDEDAPARP